MAIYTRFGSEVKITESNKDDTGIWYGTLQRVCDGSLVQDGEPIDLFAECEADGGDQEIAEA